MAVGLMLGLVLGFLMGTHALFAQTALYPLVLILGLVVLGLFVVLAERPRA